MPTPRCIDLRERFGDRYKIEHDPSYHAERPEFRAAEEAWLMQIPCKHGHIAAWGMEPDPQLPQIQYLAACTNKAGSVAKRLKALPFIYAKYTQDGSDGVNVVFPVEHFEEVAEIMHPRRRRRLSPEARRAAGERLAKYQFQPAVGSPNEQRPCASGAQPDPEHLSDQRRLFEP